MLEPDTYESSGIDEAEYEELTVAQRRAAESIIARREREAQRTRSRGRRRPAALATSDGNVPLIYMSMHLYICCYLFVSCFESTLLLSRKR